MLELNKNVKYVKGVGPAKEKLLNRLEIFTLQDLITYFPRTYENRNKPKKIAELISGEDALIEVLCVSKMTEIRIKNNMTIYKLVVRDDTGTCIATWFNQKYLKTKFQQGKTYKLFGKIKKQANGSLNIVSPVFDNEDTSRNTGKIMPIYPTIYDLSQNVLRTIIQNGLKEINENLAETLPEYLINEYKLISLNDAIQKIHFPQDFEEFDKARKRLVFEELLVMQLSLLSLKNEFGNTRGICFNKDIKMSEIINDLPFKLTGAQTKVLEEIEQNMENTKNMNRLLQGDVGCGKTVVSMVAAYKAIKSDYQVAVMVPTAILAKQHFDNFQKVLFKYGINIEMLISGTTAKKKEQILQDLSEGKIDMLIGTHALLQENVVFKNLGLVITDEQHRFGVRQRGIITKKGETPDVLVMTATPIPRTLALILYGDLDISIIDELPPNRQKIDTFAVTKSMDGRVNDFIKKQIEEGRQIYVVCPLVEECEEIDAQNVLALAEQYKNETFKDYRVEYIHGKLKNREKEQVMQDFKDGNIDILIATTVIEVGVDVPNANVMVIENAERFGLATLHQLRGRVGRGEYKSYCILRYNGNSDPIRQRMKIMTETNDGFKVSEKDLELRGSGEFFGTKQHGIPEFKIANLFEDIEVLKSVQSVAIKIMSEDKKLKMEKNALLKQQIKEKFTQLEL